MKRILVIGKNSYIGKAFESFAKDRYEIKMINSRNGAWKSVDFTGYDCVLYCAGIAHIKQKKSIERLYYEVNCDITVEVAAKAKTSGIRHFIFLSSMAVYGTLNPKIDIDTIVPCDKKDFYGNSKAKAEQELKKLVDDNFKICIVRPPMVYGKGCKGNFPKLVKLASVTPVFPDYPNKRSMIYIENLCSFICCLINNDKYGIFLPQNDEYVNTTELVRCIAQCQSKRIVTTKIFNPLIRILIKVLPMFGKLFGDLYYDKQDIGAEYIIMNFKDSISGSIPEK